MDRNQVDSMRFTYNSKLREWDKRASVRTKPRRVLLVDEESGGKIYFPPELVPVSQHPMILERGPSIVRKILIQHLYTYLYFTAVLEHRVINSAALEIAHQGLGVEMPEEMRFDAFKLYCDESYHALFSADFMRQIEAATGIAPIMGIPQFLQRLRKLQSSVPSGMRSMIEVFFTIVSETLISANLAKIPRNNQVVSPLRELVADHAMDEGRHHVYCASLLETLWPQLSAEQQTILGPLLPELILGFLEPDVAAVKRWLAEYGMGPHEIGIVMEETYSSTTQKIEDFKEDAKDTLRYIEYNGILEDPRTVEAFQSSGLV